MIPIRTPNLRVRWSILALLCVLSISSACGGEDTSEGDTMDASSPAEIAPEDIVEVKDFGSWQEGECVLPEGEEPPWAAELGCMDDFEALASSDMGTSIPGAISLKTVIDTYTGELELYFTNADPYGMHYDFCKDFLSGNGMPFVPEAGTFNSTEYFSPYRRFYLGSITYYSEPGVWTYEIVPYDTALPEMIESSYRTIAAASFFGDVLYYHPTSEPQENHIDALADDIKVVTTDEIFRGVSFLPLNTGVSMGQLRFIEKTALESGTEYVTPRDIVVLDEVPNDIPVVAGIITEAFQTPLSHINVLSQTRKTPNMSLKGATSDETLLGLQGSWVKLTVTPTEYSVEAVTKAEADEWFEGVKPTPVDLPPLDLENTQLTDVGDIGVDDIPTFGGKASNYGELSRIGDKVPVPKAFAIPVYYYKQFEAQNGFDDTIDAMLADPTFHEDFEYRKAALASLQDAMLDGVVDETFMATLMAKLESDFPGVRMRFRSSTNAEDLNGFTGAGLYTSKTGDPNDPDKPVDEAIKKVWASLWNLRAYEEREYYGIDQTGVAMALLVHRSFPDEDANGVALTNNIFDPMEPAFYINVQKGEVSVVLPSPHIIADQLLYYYSYAGKPITYLAHSTLVPEGETVLTKAQIEELGVALNAIHNAFSKYYYESGQFYAMDVEFKFDTDPGDTTSKLWVKQARPHSGWSSSAE